MKTNTKFNNMKAIIRLASVVLLMVVAGGGTVWEQMKP